MAYSLDSQDLGVINSENSRKNAGFVVIPNVYGDSSGTEVVELLGPQQVIEVTGVKISTTFANLVTFATFIKNLVSGTQATHTYVSDLIGTVSCAVQDVSFDWSGGSPFVLNYRIVLVEGTIT